jgi:hypothetical protein
MPVCAHTVRRPLVWAILLAALLLSGGPDAANAHSSAARSSRGVGKEALRGPIGWQAYRRLDLLPYVREGVITHQASSADPTGHNDDGFTGKYSCLDHVRLGCVMAERRGPGELDSVWTAGSDELSVAASGDLIIQLDGRTVVDKTWPQLTAGRPPSPFVFPLVLSAVESWGGTSLQIPMTFRREMRVISQFNPHYFHVVYQLFSTVGGLENQRPGATAPADIVSELRRAGTHDPKPSMGHAAYFTRAFHIRSGRRATVMRLLGSGAITALRLRLSRYAPTGSGTQTTAAADVYKNARLLISFDGRRTVDAPIGEFFGSGLGPARVRSLMFAMDGGPSGWATSWWPMPFASDAKIEVYNASRTAIARGQLSVAWARNGDWTQRLGAQGRYGYFHAMGHRGPTTPGSYWTFLSTRGAGTFVGVTVTMEGGSPPGYLEGNERAYVDGARAPQIQGTGTEDFFDGGWYFFDRLFTLPLSGYTAHETPEEGCPTSTCKTAYRIMISDDVPFSRSIVYEIQHGPENNVQANYSSTAYWYQRGRDIRPMQRSAHRGS